MGESKTKKGLIVTGTILCTALILLSYICWSKFADELYMFKEQKPALCVDGRQIGEPLSQAKFVVDDTKVHKNSATMRCGIPVSVYPCNNTEATSKTDCRHNPIQSIWPARTLEVGINCVRPGAWNIGGNDHCDQKDWSCTTVGACDAYEKTRRLCANLMQPADYFCWHAPRDETIPIEIEKTNFPIAWCVGSILTALTILCFLHVLFFDKKEPCKVDDHWAKSCASLFQMIFSSAVTLGCVWLVVWIIQKLTGADKNENIKASEYLTLQQAMWPKNVEFPGGPTNFTMVPEEPVPEGMQWWHGLLIGLGTFSGVCCCIIGFAMWRGDECNRHNPYRLEDDSEDSISEPE